MDAAIYLDHAATTPLRPEAFEAMAPWLTSRFGNPSGGHAVARAARAAIDDARESIAADLGCDASEVVFTSGGTEADNLAVRGVPGRVACSAVEHHAVLEPVHADGGAIVGVDSMGRLDLGALDSALTPDVTLVSVMLANNETGVVQDLAAVAAVVAGRALLHTDAVQAVPWIDVARCAAPAALISVSSHKFGGPQGVGGLVVRRATPLRPLLLGGGQERERRSGTHNVAGIVGMAAALRATCRDRDVASARVAALRDALVCSVDGAVLTAGSVPRLPNIAHLRIPGVEAEALLVLLDEAGVCASAGASCASGAMEPSHVLAAMGVTRADARTAIRLSLGRTTTDEDVRVAAGALKIAIARLRAPVTV